jgi:DNA replication and repair protein RecF
MLINSIELKNFRCFEDLKLSLNHRAIIIHGNNGRGKTTLVEAIYYLCYFRSFRSRLPDILIREGSNHFFIKGTFQTDLISTVIQIGYAAKKKSIKINDKPLSSYRDVLNLYRVVIFTNDDIDLIKEGPQGRRQFIDQVVMLNNISTASIYQEYNKILKQRNASLEQKSSREMYVIWFEKLYDLSQKIIRLRIDMLQQLESMSKKLIDEYFNGAFTIDLKYKSDLEKFSMRTYEEFLELHPDLFQKEYIMKRSLFGAHLDDIVFYFQETQARSYSSRGQQKIALFLIKMSQVKLLREQEFISLLIFDDFISDFDIERIKSIISIISKLDNQLIFTSPYYNDFLKQLLEPLLPFEIALEQSLLI